ncbi:MAG: ATP-binding protein [Vicinamibacterales bacterium]
MADRRYEQMSAVSLPSSIGLIAFEFSGGNFRTRPEAMVYRYRLTGHDDEWQTTHARRVEYQDLTPGSYTFEVEAVDRDLVRSQVPATLRLTVHLPYGTYALWSALLVALGLVSWQTARVVRRDRRLSAQNRELTTEHARSESLVVELTDTLAELHATQAELVQAAKMASLGKLAAGIAHEINNPIGALKSTSDNTARCVDRIEDLLASAAEQDAAVDSTELQRLVRFLGTNSQVLVSASDRVTQTVSSLVEFTRLDEAEFDRVDLHRGLDSTLALIRNEIRPDVRVVKEFGDLPDVECHPAQLNQVFMCLLTNAAQATDSGGTITVRTGTEGNEVRIEITDTGPGIPADQLDGLFDPGFTSDGERVSAGMSLFASAHIVRQHGGRIDVASAPGEGSTFTVILPV